MTYSSSAYGLCTCVSCIVHLSCRFGLALRGVFAGNIFDLGAAASAELHAAGGVSFAATRDQLLPREWRRKGTRRRVREPRQLKRDTDRRVDDPKLAQSARRVPLVEALQPTCGVALPRRLPIPTRATPALRMFIRAMTYL